MTAITSSVAASPIFFKAASGPFENSFATYDVVGSPPRDGKRVASRSAILAKTKSDVPVDEESGVEAVIV